MLAHSTESKKDWESEKEKRNRKKVSFDSVWNIQQPPIFVSKVHISRHIIYDISGSVLFLFFKRLLPGSVESAFFAQKKLKRRTKAKNQSNEKSNNKKHDQTEFIRKTETKYTAEKMLQREHTHAHIVHIDMPWRMCDSAHIFANEIS